MWKEPKTSNEIKLNELENLCNKSHSNEKVLIFTQFADTAEYLGRELMKRKIPNLEFVTGGLENPNSLCL